MKNFLIKALGGFTDNEHKKIENRLENAYDVLHTKERQWLIKEKQMNKFLLYITDGLHNYNDADNSEFSIKVRNLFRQLRMYTCYARPYQVIETELFEELEEFLEKSLSQIFFLNKDFPDELYEKAVEITSKINMAYASDTYALNSECFSNYEMPSLEDVKTNQN